MLTVVEAISLAGDRAKQNDDALGYARGAAWVIDGATDLHASPLTGAASDAAWIAHNVNAFFHAHGGAADADGLRSLVGEAAASAALDFTRRVKQAPAERWKYPICSLLIAAETASGVEGLDLGDCRAFGLSVDGQSFERGGPERAADSETKLAAAQTDAEKPLLERTNTIDMLRRLRARQNGGGGSWTFCLDPACAEKAQAWTMQLARPAHVLLATDGFSALVDRYAAYSASELVKTALERGLQELGRELRAIETADSGGAQHPRFKASDDGTAVLLRLS